MFLIYVSRRENYDDHNKTQSPLRRGVVVWIYLGVTLPTQDQKKNNKSACG
jgi:hypothetical protein